MNRRSLLIGSVALAAAPLALAAPARDAQAGSPFRLLRLDAERRIFVPAERCAATGCEGTDVRFRFDAFLAAAPKPVLESLRVEALFDVGADAEVPYLVWNWREGRTSGNSRGIGFLAGRENLRRLALDYRLDGVAARSHCTLSPADTLLTEPGRYVLAGPRADGRPADLERFTYSGEPADPLLATRGGAREFDVLAFRIEAA